MGDELPIPKINHLAAFLAEAPVGSDNPAAVLALEFNANVSAVLELHQLNQKYCSLVTQKAKAFKFILPG